ncbi:hypothetical protein WR25_20400 isoform A [Diploscapter pachys]|uniref:BPTI/Kunitz inhibitor domain-containing protein n=1 Tax=Diploscapter pachys TaxID=2018661 RepID=A0A2A2JLU2_9BILA|nr:hypothetical protein WR25_20400 isoform A [Diploscapter pachys]
MNGLQQNLGISVDELQQKLDTSKNELQQKFGNSMNQLQQKIDIMNELQQNLNISMDELQQKLNISTDELQQKSGNSKNELQRKLDTSKNELQKKIDIMSELQQKLNISMNQLQQKLGESKNELQQKFDNSMNGLQQKLNISMDGLQQKLNISMNELQQKSDDSKNELQKSLDTSKNELQQKIDIMNELQQKLNISMNQLQQKLGESKNELQQKFDNSMNGLQQKLNISMNGLQQKFDNSLKIYQDAKSNKSQPISEYVRGGTVAPSMIVQCAQSKDQGSVCHPGYKLVWHYDTTEGRCMEFRYGGCDGNQNRFGSREACEKVCVEPPGIGRCYLPKIEGPLRCDQPVARYWYDYNIRQCAAFWWRGCLGNANNFESWEACSQTCKNVGPLPAEPEPTQPEIYIPPNDPKQTEVPIVFQPAQPDDPRQGVQDPRQEFQPRPRISIEEVCRSNSDPGPCQEHSEAWTFNSYKGDCEQFTYGGCGGNYNRFQIREECWRLCGFLARAAQQPQAPIVVHQPNVPGPVISQEPAAADPNLAGKTRDACRLNVDVGRCKGAYESWAYEVATGTCVAFKYTGCGGNQNRFSTKEACEALCLRPAGSEESADGASGANTVCDETKDVGPCTNFATKWYYNKADGTCNRFHYGGCQGTGNRFDNEDQCKVACGNHQG